MSRTLSLFCLKVVKITTVSVLFFVVVTRNGVHIDGSRNIARHRVENALPNRNRNQNQPLVLTRTYTAVFGHAYTAGVEINNIEFTWKRIAGRAADFVRAR